MPRRSLIVALAVVLTTLPAAAHLRAVGGSLLDLLARGDGVLVVEVLSATEDPPDARTKMRVVQPLGGETPSLEFDLRNAPSPMRYAAGQRAVVVVERDGEHWQAIQLAGEGLVLDGEKTDPAIAGYVSRLWKATRGAGTDDDLGLLLRSGLALPHQKVRLLAALDIAEIAHHQPGLSPAARTALQKDLDDPELDPAARLAISRALGSPP